MALALNEIVVSHKEDLPQYRLALYAQAVREKAYLLQFGEERNALLRKARQAESAAYIHACFNLPAEASK